MPPTRRAAAAADAEVRSGGSVQFINHSIITANEISNNSYWDFGDGTISAYINYDSPMHTYTDTGTKLLKTQVDYRLVQLYNCIKA